MPVLHSISSISKTNTYRSICGGGHHLVSHVDKPKVLASAGLGAPILLFTALQEGARGEGERGKDAFVLQWFQADS